MPCYNSQRTCGMSRESQGRMSGESRTGMPMPENTMPPRFPSLAVGMVVTQPFNSPTYDLSKAFMRGTIYPDLDKPYIGRSGYKK